MQGEGARAAQDEVQLVRGGRVLEHGPRECRLGRSQGRNPITTGRRGEGQPSSAERGRERPGLRRAIPSPACPGNESAAKEGRCRAALLADGGGRVTGARLIVRGHTPIAGNAS
jgi:hypothetical protein